MANDPVFYDTTDEKWYFWDETWAFSHGPWQTEQLARSMLQQYCWAELGPVPENKIIVVVQVTDIEYDLTTDEDPAGTNTAEPVWHLLNQPLKIVLDKGDEIAATINDFLADRISNDTGWCVQGITYEFVT